HFPRIRQNLRARASVERPVFARLAMAWTLLSGLGEWASHPGVRQGRAGRRPLLRAPEGPNAENPEVRGRRGRTFHAEWAYRSRASPRAATTDRSRASNTSAHARPGGGEARRSRRGELPRALRSGWRDAGKLPCIRPRVDRQRASGRQRAAAQDSHTPESRALTSHMREETGMSSPDQRNIVGNSVALRHVLHQVEIVAPTDATVLLLGETGTGKELVARAIHDASGRSHRPFIKINCAAIPSGLLESELFGHERGAFTGAIAQKVGRFELGDGGTLFLDEVGEIPLELQPKLLRVLQEQEFERLGGTRTITVDVRLIAATNRDLAGMVEERCFRDDLYYRLNVFPIHVPPLRERPEDIPALVRFFVQRLARPMNRHVEVIPSEALEALRRYAWPGNVRELANLIERAMILSRGRTLEVPLDELVRRRPGAGGRGAADPDAERGAVLRALEQANWVLAGPRGAAARLGMKRTTLQSLMKRLGIEKPA